MPDITINGIIVNFPFQPYSVQEEYMTKVIECLQNSKHGVLESPTGTGKTLSLLCSSLSWLLTKKAQLQAEVVAGVMERSDLNGHYFNKLTEGLNKAAGIPDKNSGFGWGIPKIIYASRTHSQLSQAMQELKRTSYKHVSVAVLGSRDQLCIHPEVSRETNSFNKIQMCHVRVKSRTCPYYNNVETRKEEPCFKQEILDIEDLVKAGVKMKCCPYFLSKELKQNADITFMPYNYLLDPRSRKSQGIDIQNNVILLDEAHNIEKTCEEAASLQISSTNIAMCIDDITAVMEDMSKDLNQENDPFMDDSSNVQREFTAEDLCVLKTMFLSLEKAIDEIPITKSDEGETFAGGYIFELLSKSEITHGKEQFIIEKLEKIVSYLSTTSTSPFARKGNALQMFSDVLRTVFSSNTSHLQHTERIKECYKVYVQMEEQKKNHKSDGWHMKKIPLKNTGKIVSYWCFSPGFGMRQLTEQGVRAIVLTSGTLSPLKPFISELGIPIEVQLENPHIVTGKQVCVGVINQGPDNHPLNSSYNTRNDPKYIASLGRTIYNLSCLIPHGLLVFFPSYPIMQKCRDEWQLSGLWIKISEHKPIYVEPQSKEGFINVMHEYYQKIQNPPFNGAIFMAVCRGKVSEGLDFANANGRAVVITGLPFPPMKDPRIVLKQKYLEEIRSKNKEGLSGQQWYQLEAFRAVNQAIGRIIRHKNDYGAILLCDCRFDNSNFKQQISAWLRPHIKKFSNFGIITKEIRDFFRYAEQAFPQPKLPSQYSNNISLPAVPPSFDITTTRSSKCTASKSTTISEVQDTFNINQYTTDVIKEEPKTVLKTNIFSELLETETKSVINFSNCKVKQNVNSCNLIKDVTEPAVKKRKIKMLPVECNTNLSSPSTSTSLPASNSSKIKQIIKQVNNDVDKRELGKTYIKNVKKSLTEENYKIFATMIKDYTKTENYDELLKALEHLFPPSGKFQHLFIGFRSFLKKQHIALFDDYIDHIKIIKS